MDTWPEESLSGMQVLLPSAPNGREEVADWVFKRTPAELKAAMLEARRKREQSEVSPQPPSLISGRGGVISPT